ncbi:MAG: EPS-associated transcriptional regulator, MarR family [Halomonas sp. HL-93]|nr:MAG: EPS-associated transcriptional regulator, MarR family [Halomonas sp. HL-93]
MRVDEDTRFRMMRLIEADPNISQRRIARELGISVGAVNYCLNALIEKGLVKIENFRASSRKLSYIYMLTPKGVSEKAGLTRGFLLRKMAEYEALKAEIEEIREHVEDMDDVPGHTNVQ